VFQNLLANALKFRRGAAGRGAERAPQSRSGVTVADNGPASERTATHLRFSPAAGGRRGAGDRARLGRLPQVVEPTAGALVELAPGGEALSVTPSA
jgi:hypothetical protein